MDTATIERPGRFVTFTVAGVAIPAGSKRAFFKKGGGRPIVTDDNPRTKSWQGRVADAATEAMDGPLLAGPLELILTFTVPRPQGHYGTGRNAGTVRQSAPLFPVVKPDVTKLVRAVEDALTGIVWRDDAQVISQHASKVYGEPASCAVEVLSLEPVPA